jgi:hypothetical protein
MAKGTSGNGDVAARHSQIVALRARGRSWAFIAEETGLSDRHCRRVWKDWREAEKPSLEQLDPVDVVIEMFARSEAQIEQLAEIADDRKAGSAVRVGAINAMRAAQQAQIELLQETGYMPRNLGRVQRELDLRYLMTKIVAVFEKYGLPDEARLELISLTREREHAPLALPRAS